MIAQHINYAGLAKFISAVGDGTRCWTITYAAELIREESYARWYFVHKSDVIVAISEYGRRLLLESGADARKIAVCYPTVDARRFEPGLADTSVRERMGLRAGRCVLSIGRMDRGDCYKGFGVLIQAMPMVRQRCGDVQLLLVGGGDDIPRLRRLAKVAGVETAVQFAGWVSDADLRECYRACDVFALISQKEGFGLVFLEALACGKPVIAGNRDASREVLMEGELGLLVDPDSPTEVAQAVVRILEGRVPAEWRDPLYLRRRALEKFGFEAFTRRLEQLLIEREPAVLTGPIVSAAHQ